MEDYIRVNAVNFYLYYNENKVDFAEQKWNSLPFEWKEAFSRVV